jgi:hypothetical protein
MTALRILALLTTALLLAVLARLFARWHERDGGALWALSTWVCVMWSTVVVFGVIVKQGV